MDEQKKALATFTKAITDMVAKNESSYNSTRWGRNRYERVREYSLEEIKRICFYIEHINDFVHYKDEVPYYYEHSAVIRKISALSISEKMIENAYDFKSCGID